MTHINLPILLPECKVDKQHFCGRCRDLEGGRTMRAMLLQHHKLNDVSVDFGCIKGYPWGYQRPGRRAKQVVVINVKTAPYVPRVMGPGDHLHRLIVEQYHIAPCQRCLELIARMNRLGVSGSRESKQALIDDIWERRNMLKGWKAIAAKLPGSAVLAKREIGRLFDRALVLADKDQQRAQTETDPDA